MQTETRSLEVFGDVEPLELRAEEGQGTRVGGYIAKFNTRSKDLGGGLQEIILPGAFAASLTSGRDVLCVMAHDMNRPLARTANKTLRLWEDQRGLRFEAQLPDVSWARDLAELVKTGTASSASFGFTVPQGGDGFTQDGPIIVRTVKQVNLFEVSVGVPLPAYDATSVSLRVDPAVITRAKENRRFTKREMVKRYLDCCNVS